MLRFILLRVIVGLDHVSDVSLRLAYFRVPIHRLNWLHDLSAADTSLFLLFKFLEHEVDWIVRGEKIFLKIEAECLLDLLQVIALQLDLFLLDLGCLYESCRDRMCRQAQPLELLGQILLLRVRVALFLK